eukprot:6203828-Pleurochrysis_carterae.AAC.6
MRVRPSAREDGNCHADSVGVKIIDNCDSKSSEHEGMTEWHARCVHAVGASLPCFQHQLFAAMDVRHSGREVERVLRRNRDKDSGPGEADQ